MNTCGGGGKNEYEQCAPTLIPPRPKRTGSEHHISGFNPKAGWVHPQTSIPFHRLHKLMSRIDQLSDVIGEKPKHWRKPTYGNLDYTIAHKMGWISDEEEGLDRQQYERRRERSLKHCHTPNPVRYGRFDSWSFDFEKDTLEVRRAAPIPSGAYIPEMPSSILKDKELTDGAKICLAKILEETYRNNRDQRWLAITVPYLMTALSRSRRTIQNYLRLLEQCGYITCEVILSETTRMCNGLILTLQETCFARHHLSGWPQKKKRLVGAESETGNRDGNPGAQKDSQNYFTQIYISKTISRMPVRQWALKSMNAIFKRFQQNNAPYSPPHTIISV